MTTIHEGQRLKYLIENQDWYKQRNHTANYYNCLVLHKRCLLVIENMQNWQPDKALIK